MINLQLKHNCILHETLLWNVPYINAKCMYYFVMRWHLWSFSFCKTTKILRSYVMALSSVCRQNGLGVITWVVDDGFCWILNYSSPVKPLDQINHVCWDYTLVVSLSILCNSRPTSQMVIISNKVIYLLWPK